jgi:hypothetical protein
LAALELALGVFLLAVGDPSSFLQGRPTTGFSQALPFVVIALALLAAILAAAPRASGVALLVLWASSLLFLFSIGTWFWPAAPPLTVLSFAGFLQRRNAGEEAKPG